MDVGRAPQWYPCVALTKLKAKLIVHYVVHHPHSGFGNSRWKFVNFDAVELIHIDFRKFRYVQVRLKLTKLVPVIIYQLTYYINLKPS